MPGPPQPPAAPSPTTPTRRDIEDMIRVLAKEENVDPDFALSIAEVESNFNPTARSRKDARGIMQLMPATAKQYGIEDPAALDDPVTNIRTGLKYLRALDLEHQGRPTMVARRYVGSPRVPPERTDFYVRRVFDIYRRRAGLPPDTANADTDGRVPAPARPDDSEIDPIRGVDPGPTAARIGPPPPFWSWAAHPTLSGMVDAYDPRKREGRQNIAGGIGSVAGGFTGGAVGTALGGGGGAPAGPAGTAAGMTTGGIWGARAGSALGAGLAGGLEQAALEETGIGDRLFGKEPEAPEPGSTYDSRIRGAMISQGGSDIIGQGLMAPFRVVGKRLVQTPIAEAAAEKLSAARQTAAEAFEQSKIVLGQQLRAAQRAATNAASDLAADVTRRMEAFKADQLVRTIRPAKAELAAARGAGKAERAGLVASHDTLIDEARKRADDLLTGATTARDTALAERAARTEANLQAAAPSARDAGARVADVFENAAQVPRRTLGAAVDAAAASGPARNIAALKAEARRLANEELRPPAEAFPKSRPLGPDRLVDQLGFEKGPPRPGPADDPWLQQLTDITAEARGASMEPVQKHKAADIITRIFNAPDEVPFATLHQWKKELQDSIRGTYDKALRSRVQGMTMKLTQTLRETLRGHAPYDEATKAYEDVIPRYTTQLARTIRRSARSSPEDIAQMIDMDKPTQAGFLTKLMTEAATEGGDAKGGRKALETVQDVWFYTHVLEGSLDTLGDRLNALKRRPDFVKAFLGDSRMKGLIARAEQLAAEGPQLAAFHEAQIAAAKEAGESGLHAAKTAKHTALTEAEELSAADIRRATERVTQVGDEARAARGALRASHRAEQTQLARSHQVTIDALKAAKETAKSPALDDATAALERLNRSTLGGKNLRSPVQVGADLIGAMRPTSVFSGLSRMRLLLGASDADIARYVVHASLPVKTLTRLLVTSTLARTAPAIASAPVKAAVGKKLERGAERLSRPREDESRRAAPPAPPR